MRVAEIKKSPTALSDTMTAMGEGADVVVQAQLEHGGWAGRVDVLLRESGESRFGAWRYEPKEFALMVARLKNERSGHRLGSKPRKRRDIADRATDRRASVRGKEWRLSSESCEKYRRKPV